MNTRKVLLGVMVLLLFAGLPSLALAAVSSIVYTGPLFCRYGGNLFTSQLATSPPPAFGDPVPIYGVLFQGMTVWGYLQSTTPVLSDASGAAATPGNWYPNVYRMLTTALVSPPVSSLENVLTVYSRDVRGIACGGEVGVGPVPTRATVGFIYQNMGSLFIPPGANGTVAAPLANIRTFLMNVDPDTPSPNPAYRIWAVDFKYVLLNVVNGKVVSVDVIGKCYFQQAGSQPANINMQARFDFASDPKYPLLSLKVWRQTITAYTVIIDEQNLQIKNGGSFVKTM